MRSGGGLAQKLGATMNIWRFATIVAGSSVTVVLVAIFSLAAYMGRLSSLTTGNVFELLLGMLVFSTLIFSIITFPYYWFRIMRVSLKTGGVNMARLAQDNRSDLQGIFASMILMLITLLLGHFLNMAS